MFTNLPELGNVMGFTSGENLGQKRPYSGVRLIVLVYNFAI